MAYLWLANVVVIFHAAFVVFVVFGAFAVLRWPRLAWVHAPAALWGAAIEFGGWTCPLTPLENAWLARAGAAGYAGGFVEHYLLAALYPAGLTCSIQWALGGAVLVLNLGAYAALLRRRRRGHNAEIGARC